MNSAVRPALSAALGGCTIVIAVDRRSAELATALERHGATVRHAPALTIVSHIDDESLVEATRQLIDAPPDVVVATTGVGFRGWMEAADEAGLQAELHDALSGAQIVARGPKARGAIQQAGLTADWVAESETSEELGSFLLAEGVAGRRVAVQHHGSGADGLDELFADAGADVVSLTVYRWGPPPDAAAVARSVAQTAQGEVDAVLFTSAPGAAEWLATARREGALEAIVDRAADRRLLLAAVGPITAGPVLDAGADPLIAERGRLGSLVRAVVTHFGGGSAPSLDTAAGRLELRSTAAVLDGQVLPLSRASLSLLRALFDARGGVVARADLAAALPRSGGAPSDSAHAVDVAIGRTRDALGIPTLIRTVVKRGYRLDVASPEGLA
ncbi:uroporphyrinogen-III synthase [Microbacterium sp. EYE_5]|uniref:uroporphyrinogen-III synthase n=1 Tax=unclassified Microbacterium TaxID=2609290 RepID=UPI0020054BF8|nr:MULTISPECIES: uroporphyrinogen-III synthase [unclassified Microbacterium]MCK6079435.1 uroporphyrinogen-III synthase [Microbacterium sp. EYE_382]MCK6084705.1 uroporphyrinogen-III synthase [Microbacterium sp. EYE_384]MCK6123066.1 uroporphyrinogen-III synthase [Microbacterium sp. EYE_80]MCK6125469.1 uroporphyrinogen-III synthase [Microbacterium sp. EYE_79]MCK6140389.1 uroporphyrinogen-III synthase [Microbacterium sp. EYE_39]